jgi:tRNA threonylcarbamoyl adenosine modification protein YeaZ
MPHLLAIESSDSLLSLAVVPLGAADASLSPADMLEENLLPLAGVFFTSSSRQPTAERLLPAVDFLLRDAGITAVELAGIAINAGPGSFTGLRVGAVVAKTIAERQSIPLVPVPGLLARALAHLGGRLQPGWPVVVMADARRGEVFGAVYDLPEDALHAAAADDADAAELRRAMGGHQSAGHLQESAGGCCGGGEHHGHDEDHHREHHDEEHASLPWRTLLKPVNAPAAGFLLEVKGRLGGRPCVLCCSQQVLTMLGQAASGIPPTWEYMPGEPPAQVTAREVAALGRVMLRAGATTDPVAFEPRYIREADAKLPAVPQPPMPQ